MLRPTWLRRLSAMGTPRAARRRLHAFHPGLLCLEPRELLTVAAVAPAGALEFKEGASATMNLGQFSSPDAVVGIAFQVSIDWGDGTPIDDQLLTFPTTTFQVAGTHAFADETAPGKPNIVTVTVTDSTDTASASLQDTASVAD